MSIFEQIVNGFNEHIDNTSKNVEILTPYIAEATNLFVETLLNDRKILCATSGNSFAVGAQFCHQLLLNGNLDRPSLPVILLGNSISHLWSMIDQSSIDFILSNEINSIAQKGDLLFIISSNGSEKNLSNAIDISIQKDLHLIVLTSDSNKEITSKIINSGVVLHTPKMSTKNTLGMQFVIIQILCDLIEKNIFGESEL